MYEIVFQSKAEKFLKKLDKFEQNIIANKLEQLMVNPRLGKPLVANLAGLWSLRIGKYRAIYQIVDNKLVIYVLNIGHRKNIY